ncbi:voltage-gated chloride channel family protein [Flavobacterium sp.]|uniref:voltage-gated chloride channel family protein n=1 Tax=Flavobacterium sp. TaxID=239 RepID=UPI003FA5E1CF
MSGIHSVWSLTFAKATGFYILRWVVLTLILGTVIGSASAGFLVSLDWVTKTRENHLVLLAFLPLAGLVIGLVYHYYGKEVQAGNNLLLDTLYTPKEKIPFKMAPLVYLGTLLTHLFGGSAGREGTAVQMAGALGDQITPWLKLNPDNRKTLLTAAVAAGFASVFGTPLAGAIFGLEVVRVGKVRYPSLLPVFAAAIWANYVTHLWQVAHTPYRILAKTDWEPVFFVYCIGAGILFGLTAAAFSKLMHGTTHVFNRIIAYPPLRPFWGGVLVAVGVWVLGTSKYIGLGLPTILESFDQPLPFAVFALKLGFTVLTLGAGFKGGEVTPLFFIGATLGSALSGIIPLPTALLAAMGFVAVFAGATNTPLACTVMGLELFGIENGTYLALACVVAYLSSGHHSIYTSQRVAQVKLSHLLHHKDKKGGAIHSDQSNTDSK